MEDLGFLLTKVLAFATLIGNLASIGLLIFFVIRRSIYERIMDWLASWAMQIGFLISFGATLGSIIYSDVVGFPACILCWIQRIFIYPQMFLFGLAWYRKDGVIIAPYMLLLSLIGGAVALYNWAKNMLLQYADINVACPVVPGLPSCDKLYVLELGYITIAMMALNTFIWLAIVMYALMQKRPS
jgi:disulfide bond formation protein DsbB